MMREMSDSVCLLMLMFSTLGSVVPTSLHTWKQQLS